MPDGRIPFGQGVPNRGTSEQWLDDWNQQLRASPIYQNFMRRYGLPTNGRVQLSRQHQSMLEAELRANGIQIPDGMHIDQGGNLNQKNRLVRNSLIGAGIAGGGLAALGAAGVGPFAGALGGSEAAALPAGYVPGWEGNANLLGFGAYGTGGAATPYAGSAAAGAAGAGAAGAGAKAAGAGAAAAGAGMSLQDWIALGMAGAGAVGGAMSNQPDFSPNTMTTDPQLQRLLQTMQGRLDKSEPLYDSIMAMANGLLPTRYQKGGGGMP